MTLLFSAYLAVILRLSLIHAFSTSLFRSRLPTAKSLSNPKTIPQLLSCPPRKVLVIVEPSPFTYISGYANRFKEMLTYLKRASDDVVIITTDRKAEEAPKSFLGFPIHTLQGFELPVYKEVTSTFDTQCKIKRVIDSFRPDLIHVSSPSACILPATFWARRYKIPLVVSYHTDFVRYSRTYLRFPGSGELAESLMKLVLNQADLVLATSPQLQDELKNLGIHRTDVWMKGINTDVFSPTFYDDDMRNHLSEGNPDLPLLLYVGRLGAEKRIDRLKKVIDNLPPFRLAIVGEGPEDSSLRKLFAESPVYFAGSLQGESLSKAFASADLFVMPSNTETLGFVVLEALASGRPAVAVAAGGLIDIVEDGCTGYLVEDKDDMIDFTNRVRLLIEDARLREQMAQNARSWALDWSWEKATSKLRNIQYRKAITIQRARHNHNLNHIEEIVTAVIQHDYGKEGNERAHSAVVSTLAKAFDDDNY